MRKNLVVLSVCQMITAVVMLSVASKASAQARVVLFTQRDITIEFNLDFNNGQFIGAHGVEARTASGAIEGATLTNFKLTGVSLDNRVGIADLDGDRIIFKKTGTLTQLAPLADPSSDSDFQLFGQTGANFVLSGTYEVVEATGKFANKFGIGEQFPFASIATNPNWPPATTPTFPRIVPGSEYVEVYRHR